jgi:hypothetical protein
MKWLDPMPTDCLACGGRFPVPVTVLLSLRATCPSCGASLAVVGERMLTEEARIGGQVDLLLVAIDLEEHTGLVLTDAEVETAQSLAGLSSAVARLLDPAPDNDARATALVTESARRVAPRLLGDATNKGG